MPTYYVFWALFSKIIDCWWLPIWSFYSPLISKKNIISRCHITPTIKVIRSWVWWSTKWALTTQIFSPRRCAWAARGVRATTRSVTDRPTCLSIVISIKCYQLVRNSSEADSQATPATRAKIMRTTSQKND